MKWIKKVAVTPMDLVAKVIDSLSGNSKINAPSIHAVNAALAAKADTSAVDEALDLKADTSDVNTALAAKANISDVNTALAAKADTSAVNTALAGKQDTITGGASTIVSANLTANRAVVTSPEGKVGVSNVTSNELGGLSGLTRKVQVQLDEKALLTSIPSNYKIRAGSTVRNIAGGYTYDLFTNAQLNTLLGVSDVSNLTTFVGVLNGDFEAHDNRADNVAYIASTGSWQIRFGDVATGGSYRFNYIVVYFGSGN